jgi:hypothetical protein
MLLFIMRYPTFAPSAQNTLPFSTTLEGGLFYHDSSLTNNNTPSMPLPVSREAHLGGLFILGA